MQFRGLLVPEEQVADPLREDKGEAEGPWVPSCLAGEMLPSTVTFSETPVRVPCSRGGSEGEPISQTAPLQGAPSLAIQ